MKKLMLLLGFICFTLNLSCSSDDNDNTTNNPPASEELKLVKEEWKYRNSYDCPTCYEGWVKSYTYNGNILVRENKEDYYNGTLEYSTYTLYSYHDNQLLKSIKTYKESNNSLTYEADLVINGSLITELNGIDGPYKPAIKYYYDAKNNLTKTEDYLNGVFKGYTTFEYDKYGNQTKTQSYDSTGNFESSTTYTYDYSKKLKGIKLGSDNHIHRQILNQNIHPVIKQAFKWKSQPEATYLYTNTFNDEGYLIKVDKKGSDGDEETITYSYQ